jgi:bacteriocin biosynthesis cyclodehydratase domain-containing protein
MRLILRPGTHVLRRADAMLQVGLGASAVVLPDTETVRSCLWRLANPGHSPGTTAPHADGRTLGLLERAGQLVQEQSLLPLLPAVSAGNKAARTSGPGLDRNGVAALVRCAGDDSAELLAARASTSVTLLPFGHQATTTLCEQLSRLLAAAGVSCMPAGGAPGKITVGVALGVGEPSRELLDEWMRKGVPHLVVRMSEGCVTVGPFVVPGRTPCLRCLDAYHADADPSWPLLVEQYAAATRTDRADGAPEPVDAALAAVALGWAARDLASYAEGRQPSTWSRTTRLDPYLRAMETRSWRQHPECGCSWG